MRRKKRLTGYIHKDWYTFWKFGRTGKPDHTAIVLTRGKNERLIKPHRVVKAKITIEELKD